MDEDAPGELVDGLLTEVVSDAAALLPPREPGQRRGVGGPRPRRSPGHAAILRTISGRTLALWHAGPRGDHGNIHVSCGAVGPAQRTSADYVVRRGERQLFGAHLERRAGISRRVRCCL